MQDGSNRHVISTYLAQEMDAMEPSKDLHWHAAKHFTSIKLIVEISIIEIPDDSWEMSDVRL